MTYDEFWKMYHREDPNEALDNPWRLTIHTTNGKRYKAVFPGSIVATPGELSFGTPLRKNGTGKRLKICNWSEIAKIDARIGKALKASV